MPTTFLQPGATGDSVKQLQDYLKSQNLLTQAQIDTGYGTYGPQTTAAVAALQQKLGVDNSSGVGYYGPKTIAALQSTAPAASTTTPIPSTPTTINSTNTKPQEPINYATPKPTPVYAVDGLDTTVPTPPASLTTAEKSAQDLIASIMKDTTDTVGKSAYQTQQETAAGVPEAQKTVTDLSAQLVGLQNEAKAIPVQLQNEATGRGITAAGLAPIQTEQLRNNAIKALTVSTLLEAAKGNLANAQSIADKAVEQKYGPIQERITAAKANLDLILNSPEYTLEEKNRASAQLEIQNAKQDLLDKQKADATQVLTIAANAASNGADAITLKAISEAKTPAEALSIAADKGFVDQKNTQIVELNGRKVLIDTNTGATIKDLGAASSGSGSSGTAAEREANAISTAQGYIDSGKPLADGTPVTDANGYITPTAWKKLIAQAPSEGLSRATFIKQFGYLLYQEPAKDGTKSIPSSYGLTPAEIKLINGS